MISGPPCSRKAFAIFVSFVTVNCLFVVTFKLYPDFYPQRLLHQMFFIATLTNSSEDGASYAHVNTDNTSSANDVQITIVAEDDKEYREMTKDYIERISTIPRHKYNPSDAYIDIGPAISSLMNVSDKLFSGPKLVLPWTPFFGKVDWVSDNVFEKCNYRCHITTDKSKLSQSHAVLMHARDMNGRQSLPPRRESWQRWVYFILESPIHNYLKLSDFNDVFNMTLMYRRDADTRIAYGGLRMSDKPLKPPDLDVLVSAILKSKRKLVSVAISNCGASKTNRLRYIAELRKYIHVDFYGACGTMSLPRGEKMNEILKQYKFHLAFENSHCRDYITEKFWRPVAEWSSVPIVMGAAPEDYLAVAGNQSFINTAGFESPQKLAEYLHLLDKSEHLYKRYFTWLADWAAHVGYTASWCQLCSQLNNMSLPLKSYRNFDKWYREDYCKK